MKHTAIPCRLEPRLVPRIWGRRSLQPIYPASLELVEPIGEAWLSGEECAFSDGPFAGRTLGDAWREMPPEWKGATQAGGGVFPLLAKFIFPESKLSVQVHPDDGYAARHEAAAGGCGKTEMWYTVAAEPGAEVLAGLEPGVDGETIRRAIAEGNVESCLRRVPVATGDTIFIPAGTVHAIGPGLLLCELQQYSDITYRLFDYNRVAANGKPRELHVAKALDVIGFGATAGGKTRPVTRKRGPVEVTSLAACRYFASERWRLERPVDVAATGQHFELVIVLGGEGRFAAEDGVWEYRLGEAWFVPAAHAGFRIEPASPTTLLRAWVPDLAALTRELADEGVTAGEMAGFLFE